MKRSMYFLFLILVIVNLAGCYDPDIVMKFNESGEFDLFLKIEGGTMASRDDINLAFWQLKTMFPEIDENYHHDFSGKTITLHRKMKTDPENIENLTLIKKEDGSFELSLNFPAIRSSQSDSDDIFVRITAYLPGEIDLANTTDVEGNRVTWTLRKRDIHRPVRLRAVTHSTQVPHEQRETHDGHIIDRKDMVSLSEKTSHSVNDIIFYMCLAPASTFPIGEDDDGEATVDRNFWITETEVTYELWYEVRTWAFNNGYTFANKGREGSHGTIGEGPTDRRHEPVTTISWYDSIVWCNALSEMLGYIPVYTFAGQTIRDATESTAGDNVVQEDRNGFRLPTMCEWELAARYKGTNSSHEAIEHPAGSGIYWTPGDYASGATANSHNTRATTTVAWYRENSGNRAHDVKQKSSNELGLYDMSGNLYEWCFDWHPSFIGSNRVARGGSFIVNADYLPVGRVDSLNPSDAYHPGGFRFVKTSFP